MPGPLTSLRSTTCNQPGSSCCCHIVNAAWLTGSTAAAAANASNCSCSSWRRGTVLQRQAFVSLLTQWRGAEPAEREVERDVALDWRSTLRSVNTDNRWVRLAVDSRFSCAGWDGDTLKIFLQRTSANNGTLTWFVLYYCYYYFWLSTFSR